MSEDPNKMDAQEVQRDEHARIGDVGGKKVFIVDNEGNQIISFFATFDDYQYMGKQTSGIYAYYGLKKYGGTAWYVIKKNNTDDSIWKYAYSTVDTEVSWDTAWADPTALTYGDPPDA